MSRKLSFCAALVAASLAALSALQVTSAQCCPCNESFNPNEVFSAIAGDCNEERIIVYERPRFPNFPNVRLRVEERNEITADACGLAAAKILCQSQNFSSVGPPVGPAGDYFVGEFNPYIYDSQCIL